MVPPRESTVTMGDQSKIMVPQSDDEYSLYKISSAKETPKISEEEELVLDAE